MARSILPSRWRGAGRARAELHGAARRATRAALHDFARDVGAWDEGREADEWLYAELSSFVSGRRGADKLNHFMRWAARKAEHLPREQRLGHLRGLVPPGLIGEHALSHLERHPAFELARSRLPWWRRSYFLDRGEVAELLRALIVLPDGQRKLNEALKRGVRFDGSRRHLGAGTRRLLGLHDVTAFLADLSRPAARVARHVVDDFCFAFKVTRDLERSFRVAVAPTELPVFDFEYRTPRSKNPSLKEQRWARVLRG